MNSNVVFSREVKSKLTRKSPLLNTVTYRTGVNTGMRLDIFFFGKGTLKIVNTPNKNRNLC